MKTTWTVHRQGDGGIGPRLKRVGFAPHYIVRWDDKDWTTFRSAKAAADAVALLPESERGIAEVVPARGGSIRL